MADGWWREGKEGKPRRVVVVAEERWAVRPCERGYKTEFGFFFYLGGMAIGILFFPMARYWFLLDFLEKINRTVF
jgi:hypothetical protein